MKRFLVLFFCLSASVVNAADTVSLFDPQTGVLEITNLEYNEKLYYLKLRLTDPENFIFAADLGAVEEITPSTDQLGYGPSEIHGRWDFEGKNISYTFNQDGTFSMYQGPNEDPVRCPSGGSEIGQYTWTPSTGIFRAKVFFDQDNNGACGFSDLTDHVRILVLDGNSLDFLQGGVKLGRLLRTP